MNNSNLHISKTAADAWRYSFDAMASTCELLVQGGSRTEAASLATAVETETKRIERTFSRYRDDNPVHHINRANGAPIEVDAETAQLLDFAAQCYKISDGLFDITSGILRKVWAFDGSDRIPTRRQVRNLMPLVGWNKVTWANPLFTMKSGMEIDLGGIGKEYAVDRAITLIRQRTEMPALINFGGDLCVTGPREDGRGWEVGIEQPGQNRSVTRSVDIRFGALATSGDNNRFLEKEGVRYSHVLDPRTGWPVENAPRSVTVLAGTCTEAGILSTLAMLSGVDAEAFLENEQVEHWCIR